jgi:hypothetical protein
MMNMVDYFFEGLWLLERWDFTTKLDFKNKCLINHKTFFGTRNHAFWVGAVTARGTCPQSL